MCNKKGPQLGRQAAEQRKRHARGFEADRFTGRTHTAVAAEQKRHLPLFHRLLLHRCGTCMTEACTYAAVVPRKQKYSQRSQQQYSQQPQYYPSRHHCFVLHSSRALMGLSIGSNIAVHSTAITFEKGVEKHLFLGSVSQPHSTEQETKTACTAVHMITGLSQMSADAVIY